MKRLLTTLILAALTVGMEAQPSQSIFSSYSSLDGLVHNNIHHIYTDSRGFVWLCTWSGVSRFDGYHFKNYCNDPTDPTVLHNRFLSVAEDKSGHLWFRTYDDHIYRFNRLTERFEDVGTLVDRLKDESYRVGNLLCCSHSSDVWVEFQGFGVVRFESTPDGAPLTATNYIGSSEIGTDVGLFKEDSQGAVWIVCDSRRIVVATPDGRMVAAATVAGNITSAAEQDDCMAFASEHSVLRLSKTDFTPLGHLPEVAFPNDRITGLAVSPDGGALYAGTMRSGVAVLPRGADRFDPAAATGDLPTRIRGMFVDSHNTLWLTTTRAGITRFDPATHNYKHFSQRQNTVTYYSDTTSLVVERNDRVWVKMNGVGFGYYDREKDSLEPFYNDPSLPDCRMTNGVAVFEVDNDNVLWLSTYHERGLQRIQIQRKDEDIFPLYNPDSGEYSDEIRALAVDGNNNIWVGTKNGRLHCYDRDRRLLHYYDRLPSGRPLGMVYTIKPDSKGNIWVGTKGDGIYRLSPSGKGYAFRHLRHNESDEWSLSNDQVYCITEDAAGRIWVGTYGGAINMLENPDAVRFYNTGNSFPHYPKEQGIRARYILADTPERMFVGTSEGAILFNPSVSPDKTRFELYQRSAADHTSLKGNDIIHILKDSQGRIWLSTYGGGVSLVSGTGDDGKVLFETFTVNEGLSSNIVLAAAEDYDGNIWLSTENGISRFDPSARIFTKYTQYDGFRPVAFSEATAVTDSRGDVLFGGAGNLHVIDTERMPVTDYDYRLAFTNLEMQNREVAIGQGSPLNESIAECGEVRLPYNYLLFRIEFASLNFRIQNRVNYMYRLDGYDDDWTISRDINSAYYSKVPSGVYTFRVKAFVDSAQMADDEISVRIRIAAPPWLSWWAYCVYFLIVAAILVVVVRTIYTMARLRSETKMEQNMSEMKLKFFTNISHELRTPLTLIMGGIEDVQKREELSPRGEQSLTLSYKNSKRMLTLINQLLDFRKIVKDKMELKVSRADVVPIVESVIDDFRDMADERRIALLFTVARRSVPLWVDTERIESVFYNLLSNAFKFTPDKGTITISIASPQDGSVAISVSDTGVGIPKEHLGSIFDRFSQYTRALRRDVSGSGIGLALCKEIVELHHGTIRVESRVGLGSVFTVTLLTGNSHFDMAQIDFGAVAADGVAAQLVADDADACSTRLADVTPPEGAQKILLVDDNSEMRAFLYNHLIENYSVTEAVDGVDALEKIAAEQYDIVITDLMMPRMDGIELVERIRSNFETSHIPIIMLTAKHSPEDRIKAMEYGADGYITKPFSIELLLVRIDNLLTQRHLLFEKFSSGSASNRRVELSPKDVVVTDRDEDFMRKLIEWIDNNIENSELTIDDLATHLHLGRTTMYNKIKSLTGKSPVELIKEYRITKSELFLRTGQFSVSEVAYKVGFSDPSYFSRCFKEQYNISPVEYLKSHNLKS